MSTLCDELSCEASGNLILVKGFSANAIMKDSRDGFPLTDRWNLGSISSSNTDKGISNVRTHV